MFDFACKLNYFLKHIKLYLSLALQTTQTVDI